MSIEWRDIDSVEWLDYPDESQTDLYERLEVSPRASAEVIKRAYRALAEKYHPDKHQPERKVWAEEMMKVINHAYSILGDESRRREYDDRVRRAGPRT